MNDEISNPKQPIAPVLTDRQRMVLESLQSKETQQFPLSKWYLGALYALEVHNNPDRISQAAHSLRELIEKLPRVVQQDGQGRYDFKGMRRSLNDRFSKDKERYKGEWKGKEIDGPLDKTLRKFGDYLERNQQPTRPEQMQTAIAKIDPMADQLDGGVRRAKWNNLHNLWQTLEGFTHHQSEPDTEEFGKCLESLEEAVFDLLAPITAQDQREIQSILKLSDRSENDEERMLSLIERRGANFAFFFEHVNDASWIPVIKKRGYFDDPPKIEEDEEGRIVFRFWRPVLYLERVSADAPALVVDTILDFQDTDNPRILYTISQIALKVEPIEQSLRLKDWVFKYLESPYDSVLQADIISKLLSRWAGASTEAMKTVLGLMRKVVAFQPDPQAEDKQARRKVNPEDWTTSLELRPRFDKREYQEILEKCVRPLAEREPYQATRILIDAVAAMIRLGFHQDELEKAGGNDSSTSWCERVNEPAAYYMESEVNLVNALTFACEKVYENAPESIAELEEALRDQRWDIFGRIRQHLYAKFPNEQNKPWIREMILVHPDYGKWQHHFEFQRMIRLACEHFGAGLLTEVERKEIFEAILSGPSEQDYRDWMGDDFTEESLQRRRRNFHRMQLRPFVSVLFGEYRDYFQKLKAEEENPDTDDDYPPYKPEGGVVGRRSPKPTDELKEMSDEGLLAFLNEWENVGHAPDDWLTEINFEALAKAFQTVFQESLIPDESRLRFWIENRDRIERPIYARAMVSAAQERVKGKQFDGLDEWFDLCEWVLSHPDRPKEEGVNRSDESKAHPDWSSSRRAVGEFVETCVNEDGDVPVSARDRLARLLDELCTQYNRGLDDEESTLFYEGDSMTIAINNTRSRALESLVDFGYWVRRQLEDEQADTPEVFDILDKRIAPEYERPLTLPEHVLLGLHFASIFGLNREWATRWKDNFFPKDNLRAWGDAFRYFITYKPKHDPPHKPTFDVIRDEYEFALENIDELNTEDRTSRDIVDRLGERLFTYYLWDVYPLTGNESLLDRFYEKTRNDKRRWAHLFDDVGRRLKNSGKQLEKDIERKVIAFFDWRFQENEASELKEFTYWLEAECLDAEWRLISFSKILDVCKSRGIGIYSHMKTLTLQGLVEEHTALVVECFAKLMDLAFTNGKVVYIISDEVKPILRAGLKSEDAAVCENAERARENLLQNGYSEFSNLED